MVNFVDFEVYIHLEDLEDLEDLVDLVDLVDLLVLGDLGGRMKDIFICVRSGLLTVSVMP